MEIVNACCNHLNSAYLWAAKMSGIQSVEKMTMQPTDTTAVKTGKAFAMTTASLLVLPSAAFIGGASSIVKQVSEALKNAATSDLVEAAKANPAGNEVDAAPLPPEEAVAG